MIGVIVDCMYHYRQWCKNKDLFRNSEGIYVDKKGQKYIPIMDEFQLHGKVFTDFKTVDGHHPRNYKRVLRIAQTRIR